MDVGCSGENIIDQQLFEEMKASQFGYSGQLDGCAMPALSGSSSFGLVGGLPALSDGSSSSNMASAKPAMPAMPVPVDPVSDEALDQLKAAIKRKDKTEVYAMSLLKVSRSKASDPMMTDQLPKLEKSLEDLDLVASQCLNGCERLGKRSCWVEESRSCPSSGRCGALPTHGWQARLQDQMHSSHGACRWSGPGPGRKSRRQRC